MRFWLSFGYDKNAKTHLRVKACWAEQTAHTKAPQGSLTLA